MPSLFEAQRRHSVHYAIVLKQTDELYLQGWSSIQNGLALFDLDWNNIQLGHAWGVVNAAVDQHAARLCCFYPIVGAYCLALRQHPRERINWLTPALRAAQQLGDKQAEGVHLVNLGQAHAALSEPRQALEYYERRLGLARETGDGRAEAIGLGSLGGAHYALGEMEKSIEYYEQALVLARETGDRREEGTVLSGLGNVYSSLGQPQHAIEYHEQALTIAREIGERQLEDMSLGNLGNAYVPADNA